MRKGVFKCDVAGRELLLTNSRWTRVSPKVLSKTFYSICLFDIRDEKFIHDGIKGCKLVRIDGPGHEMNFEMASECLDAFIDSLKK
jgi:hypothetical protein